MLITPLIVIAAGVIWAVVCIIVVALRLRISNYVRRDFMR